MRILKNIVRLCVKYSVAPEEAFIYQLHIAEYKNSDRDVVEVVEDKKPVRSLIGKLASGITLQKCADFAAACGWLEGVAFLSDRFTNDVINWARSAAFLFRCADKSNQRRLFDTFFSFYPISRASFRSRVWLWVAAVGFDDIIVDNLAEILALAEDLNSMLLAAAFGQSDILDLLQLDDSTKYKIALCALEHGHHTLAINVCPDVLLNADSANVAQSLNVETVKFTIGHSGMDINKIFAEIPNVATCGCNRRIGTSYNFDCGRVGDSLKFLREVKELGATNYNAALAQCDDIHMARQLCAWGGNDFKSAFACAVQCDSVELLRDAFRWASAEGSARNIGYIRALDELLDRRDCPTSKRLIARAEMVSLVLRFGKECGAIS